MELKSGIILQCDASRGVKVLLWLTWIEGWTTVVVRPLIESRALIGTAESRALIGPTVESRALIGSNVGALGAYREIVLITLRHNNGHFLITVPLVKKQDKNMVFETKLCVLSCVPVAQMVQQCCLRECSAPGHRPRPRCSSERTERRRRW